MNSDDSNLDALPIHIAEYSALRAEILEHHKFSAQILLYGLGSLSIAIPLISDYLQRNQFEILLTIPVIFASLHWIYVGYQGAAYRIMIYIDFRLRPLLNELLLRAADDTPSNGKRRNTSSKLRELSVLEWEQFARNKALLPLTWSRSIEMLLLAIPSVVSIIIYLAWHNNVGIPINQFQLSVIIIDIVYTVSPLVVASFNAWFSLQVFRGKKSI